MISDIELFECFNVELPGGGDLWRVTYPREKISGKIEKLPGEPGTKERIALYRQRLEQNAQSEKSIFED